MKIKLKKSRLYTNLVFACIWITLGLLNVIGNDYLKWTDFGYLFIGALYLIHYLFDLTNQYLIIKDETIKMNTLYGFNKKIGLKEIKRMKLFPGEYTLKSENKEFKINTNLIAEESLLNLNKVLKELNIPS